MRWLIPALLGLVVVAAVAFSWRTGLFLPVTLEEKPWPSMRVLWKTHVGPYHTVLADLEEVEKWVKENAHLNCDETFGEYLDDPSVVEHERLRAHVGCLIASKPAVELPAGYEISEIPARNTVVADFRGSPALGPYKVYGKAQRYIVEKGLKPSGPPLEIYRRMSPTEMMTIYLFPADAAAN